MHGWMRKISCACSAVGMQKDQPVSEEGQLPDQPARWRACSSAPALLSAATSAPSPGDAGGPAGAGSPLRARGEGTGSLREHPAITEPRHSCLHAFSPWDMPLLCAYPQPWDAVALLLCTFPLYLSLSQSPCAKHHLSRMCRDCICHPGSPHSPVLKPRPRAGHGLWFFHRLPKYQSLWFSTSPITCFSEKTQGHGCILLLVQRAQANPLCWCCGRQALPP